MGCDSPDIESLSSDSRVCYSLISYVNAVPSCMLRTWFDMSISPHKVTAHDRCSIDRRSECRSIPNPRAKWIGLRTKLAAYCTWQNNLPIYFSCVLDSPLDWGLKGGLVYNSRGDHRSAFEERRWASRMMATSGDGVDFHFEDCEFSYLESAQPFRQLMHQTLIFLSKIANLRTLNRRDTLGG